MTTTTGLREAIIEKLISSMVGKELAALIADAIMLIIQAHTVPDQAWRNLLGGLEARCKALQGGARRNS